ncbi:hypothetical protein LXL04_005421 [Taraxacum kok-saghyz]
MYHTDLCTRSTKNRCRKKQKTKQGNRGLSSGEGRCSEMLKELALINPQEPQQSERIKYNTKRVSQLVPIIYVINNKWALNPYLQLVHNLGWLRKLIGKNEQEDIGKNRWNGWVTKKTKIFVWRLLRNREPVKSNLERIRINRSLKMGGEIKPGADRKL